MTTHVSDDDLVLYHYREEIDRDRVTSHLAHCDACRARRDELAGVLAMMDEARTPETPPDFESRMWLRVREGLDHRVSPHRRRFRPRHLALAASLVIMLSVAFLAGRLWQGMQVSPTITAQARERILLVAVGDHLERSQMMLVELININGQGKPDDAPVDISEGRRRAEDLVSASRIFRQSAALADDVALEEALEQLERLFLDIAHAPDEVSRSELSRIQERIEQQGILFKVRVIESRLRQREATVSEVRPDRT